TADSIYQNVYAIEDEKPEHVLILAGDHIYKMDYRNMISSHMEGGADLTVSLVEVPKECACEFGVCQFDNKSKLIKGLVEKPKDLAPLLGKSKKIFASMGIYLFKREVLEKVLAEDAKNKNSSHDFAKDIIPIMLGKYKVSVFDFRDKKRNEPLYWRDIGNLDAYYEANMDLVKVLPAFNLYDKDWPFRTYHEQFGPAKTVFAYEDENRIGMALNSLVSNGCIVSGGKVQSSILSPNVRINSFSEVEGCVLMEGVDVGRYAKIKRAVIDKDVNIPQKMEIGYNLEEDRKKFKVTESGIVVIPKGAVL
ncbi:MAG: sugar phosphate nucleotidyltransferase, partial [Candidatus Omnitrophota bacterium]|nr:sugar phosphate nucleotidyltransferase [Candidatus Omnitrophota bacterium]